MLLAVAALAMVELPSGTSPTKSSTSLRHCRKQNFDTVGDFQRGCWWPQKCIGPTESERSQSFVSCFAFSTMQCSVLFGFDGVVRGGLIVCVCTCAHVRRQRKSARARSRKSGSFGAKRPVTTQQGFVIGNKDRSTILKAKSTRLFDQKQPSQQTARS
jgi:hypothetical protein